jgi:formate transporter
MAYKPVANMFFIPTAIFADIPGIDWRGAVHNWIFAFLGNVVGAVIFVAAAYWFLYARQVEEEPCDTPSGGPERAGDGRATPAARRR